MRFTEAESIVCLWLDCTQGVPLKSAAWSHVAFTKTREKSRGELSGHLSLCRRGGLDRGTLCGLAQCPAVPGGGPAPPPLQKEQHLRAQCSPGSVCSLPAWPGAGRARESCWKNTCPGMPQPLWTREGPDVEQTWSCLWRQRQYLVSVEASDVPSSGLPASGIFTVDPHDCLMRWAPLSPFHRGKNRRLEGSGTCSQPEALSGSTGFELRTPIPGPRCGHHASVGLDDLSQPSAPS